ncbi:MAG: 4-hydroxy-3-methylbut-2-enyl diphosphate reductase [Cyanobacteria bacterium HKST-UBA04]|nr:4-hydroxy-3-methylbut-2-enyl diphosphate reductase [Cyanobacteria bacterium HKST-UBA04]
MASSPMADKDYLAKPDYVPESTRAQVSGTSGKTILVAEHAGFCYGVRMAVDKAFELAHASRCCNSDNSCSSDAQQPATMANTSDKPVYVLGELIHNPQVVSRLRDMGVKTVACVDDIPAGSTCLIRTHGVDPGHIDTAQARDIDVTDATCPDVRRVQDSAKQLAEEGYVVVIVGKANHPEVIGIKAHCERIEGARIVTVTSVDEFDEAFAGVSKNRIGVVSQTTQLEEAFKQIVAHAAQQCRELKVFNTICPATFKRQSAAEALAKQVDIVVVVGGKNSSNTGHLAEVCRNNNTPALHVETAEELAQYKDVLEAHQVIGVTAGASTPDWLIQAVIGYLEALGSETGVSAAEKLDSGRRSVNNAQTLAHPV